MGKAVDSKAVEVVETAQPKWGYIFVEEIEGLTGERCPRFFGLRQEEQQFVLHLITGHKRFNITAAYRAAYEPDEDAARDRVSGYRLMQKLLLLLLLSVILMFKSGSTKEKTVMLLPNSVPPMGNDEI